MYIYGPQNSHEYFRMKTFGLRAETHVSVFLQRYHPIVVCVVHVE